MTKTTAQHHVCARRAHEISVIECEPSDLRRSYHGRLKPPERDDVIGFEEMTSVCKPRFYD
jgi:hypothetical protein